MFKLWKTSMVLVAAMIAMSSYARAEAEVDADKEISQIESANIKEEMWVQQLKEKYALTDEQIKKLKDSGISFPQMAMASQLAKSSGKTIDEVLKMRTEQKMGWGKIAKELGVKPQELGHSVRDMRHAIRDERKEEKNEKREERNERKEERKNKQANRGK